MTVNGEPTESKETNEFEIPGNLTEAVADVGDLEIKQRFVDTVTNEGLDQALAISPAYIQGIQAKFGELAERTVNDGEKQAFQLMQRVLPQIALAVMLREAGEDDEASTVLDDVYAMLSQEIGGIDPTHQEYFKALLGLV